MIHDITKDQYIKDPCGSCSVAFWKNSIYKLPKNIEVIHKRFYYADSDNAQVQLYFRLLHNLAKVHCSSLKDDFYFQNVEIESQKSLVASLINNCYIDISINDNQVQAWTHTRVFDSQLWIFVNDKISGEPVGLGIADYDTEIKEGSLEWVQVLPKARKNGIGEAIVNELLLRLKNKGAEFVTVSGKISNETKPELLYRKCGFCGDDIWCILKHSDMKQ